MSHALRVKTKDRDKIAAIQLQESFVEKSRVWLQSNKVVHLMLVIGDIETEEDQELSKTDLMQLDLVNLVVVVEFGILVHPLLFDGDYSVVILLALEVHKV